jgi:hypothetical protein
MLKKGIFFILSGKTARVNLSFIGPELKLPPGFPCQ